MADRLDTPADRRRRLPRINLESEGMGRAAERLARFSGTPQFIVYLTVFVALWIGWNTLAPDRLQFDKAELGFTALTLMLSLQASYSAPLILLAQNRQDDRDRVQAEQDRTQPDGHGISHARDRRFAFEPAGYGHPRLRTLRTS